MPPELVLGTGNRKKAKELFELFAPLGLSLTTLADYPDALAVEESGDTFSENARRKATLQARHLGRWVLGEDSGLAVDALGGRPGVFSARYAGPGATDADNNAKLLVELAELPDERRTAHYVCHAVLADPSGHVRAESAGECRGRILRVPRGDGGFGYDPLFEVREYHQTFGELGAAVKSVLSHRARAIRRLVPELGRLLESGAWR